LYLKSNDEKNLISLKEINKKNILKIVIEKETISRIDISKLLKIGRPTTLAYINDLIDDGFLLKKHLP
jgi:Mn-dependent DtxR family transcriptional regulator